jgi:hypothetical protein
LGDDKTMIIANISKLFQNCLLNFDEILVFGPGKSHEPFQHHLQEDAQFDSTEISVNSSDLLLNPQVIKKVRNFLILLILVFVNREFN